MTANNTLTIAPQPDGTFTLNVGESGGGRLKHTHTWPSSKLVTLCGRAAGFERYEELPAAASLSDLAFLVSPMLWPIWADAEKLSLLDVRHQNDEGKGLKALRNGLRVHFGAVNSTDAEALELFLREVQSTNALIAADINSMDWLLVELKKKSLEPESILMRLYSEKRYGIGSKMSSKFMAESTGVDSSLPPRLQKIQTTLCKPTFKDDPPAKKTRTEVEKPQVGADEFFCQTCKKVLKKADGPSHRTSAEHAAAKKSRKH